MTELRNIISKILKFLKEIIWFLPFLLILYLTDKESEKLRIQSCENFKKETYHGKIIKKYIDNKNHNYHMLVILKDNGRDSSTYDSERSRFWDFEQNK